MLSSYQNMQQLPAPDIAIIGAGIVGLWTAYYAAQAGAQVLLLDKSKIGGGASDGILGALMPHQPAQWNDKKQFQLDGLISLPREIAKLEKLTGVACGYFRCGRIMPITNTDKYRQSLTWAKGSCDHWPKPFEWSVVNNNTAEGWMLGKGNHGYNTDNLSARVNPRGLLAALIAQLRSMKNVTLIEKARVLSVDRKVITFSGSDTINAGKIIITAGVESFGLLEPLTKKTLGKGVKGQAALLRPPEPVDVSSPIIYDNSTYIIVHDNGLVAIGSTSEREFDEPFSTDEKLGAVITYAQTICPILKNAEIVERWAAVRPYAAARDPMIGALPNAEHADIIVATGGFKITLAIAHLMAKAALSAAAGQSAAIPPSVHVEAHYR